MNSRVREITYLIHIPVVTKFGIRIRIDECDPHKSGACFDDGAIQRITNKLRIVHCNNRSRYNIGTGREVDESRLGSGGLAGHEAAAYPVLDRFVDCCRVVGSSITYTPKQLSSATSTSNSANETPYYL